MLYTIIVIDKCVLVAKSLTYLTNKISGTKAFPQEGASPFSHGTCHLVSTPPASASSCFTVPMKPGIMVESRSSGNAM